jgi:uncharacterized protein YeaO (DUF488 family)
MSFTTKRIYEPKSARDGQRILVERLWPRGVRKQDANIDEWLKEVAPSTALRQWFGHDPKRWDRFCERYIAELEAQPELLAALRKRGRRRRVTLIFSSKEERYNNAVALRNHLEG